MGEVNFSAFDLPTIELHNELYGYIQEETQSATLAAVETYFASKGLSANKTWTRLVGRHSPTLRKRHLANLHPQRDSPPGEYAQRDVHRR